MGQGVDPIEQKKAQKMALIKSQGFQMTFEKAADLCHQKKVQEFRNEKHKKDWIGSVNRYAIPIIGHLPVDEIDLPHILTILEPIWQEKTETATRLRQRIEHILTWATVSGYRKGDNPARWKGHLDAILPKPSKIRKVKHLPALNWRQIGAFIAELRKRTGMGARCLQWIILTACRSGEARLSV